MPHPLIAKRLLQLLFKAFWPWFRRHVWPLLLGAVLEQVRRGMGRFRGDLSSQVDDSLRDLATQAEARAKQADARAGEAQTDTEKRHQEELASVWREVAEQYRRENEALRAKVAELCEKANRDIAAQAAAVDPQLAEHADGAQLRMAGKAVDLPRLSQDERKPDAKP